MRNGGGHSESMEFSLGIGGGAPASGWLKGLLLSALLAVPLTVPVAAEVSSSDLICTLGDGRLLVAGVIIVDRTTRMVSVPAVVNQHRGLVEYLVVHRAGKRHESLFVTDVRPQHLHVACLLVGAPDAGAAAVTDAPTVSVTVVWQGHGPLTRRATEALLLPATHDGEPLSDTALAQTPIAPVVWHYLGSEFSGQGFAAEITGSCLALQADPSALLTTSGLTTADYIPATERLPAIGTPVTIELTFPEPIPAVVQPAVLSDPRKPS
jgi:hypothetical protein